MIDSFYEGKTILITGATGFVGKVLVEKLLFSLPQIKRIYVFIRPRKGSSVEERFRREIIESPCFDRLRDSNPKIFSEKIVPIGGDMLKDRVVLDSKDEIELIENVNIVLNSAASVDFNQRLDQALQINTLGSLRIVNLAKKFKHLQSFIQISTAYVNCDKPDGWIEEKIYPIDKNPRDYLEELLSIPVEEIEKRTPEIIGRYPNTYTFTKNLTEQMLRNECKNFPICIVRPTIIGASLKEPIQGWVDTVSAAGALILSTGLGLLRIISGKEECIGDQIPVDLVVNAVICAAVFYCKPNSPFVIHSSSSSRNPVTWHTTRVVVMATLNKFPLEKAIGKPSLIITNSKVRIKLFNLTRRTGPLFLLKKASMVLGNQNMQKDVLRFEKLIKKEQILINSFKHFVNNEWIFSGQNTLAMTRLMTPEENARFELDSAAIDWKLYIPSFTCGLKRYVLKEQIYSNFNAENMDLNWDVKPESRFSDIKWAYSAGNPIKIREFSEIRSLIHNAPRIQQKIFELSTKDPNKKPHEVIKELNAQVDFTLNTIISTMSMPVVRVFAWGLRKVWRMIYEKVVVDQNALQNFKKFTLEAKGPVVIVPTHRSYIDFLIVSYVFFAYKINLPYIAASKDFIKVFLLNHIFRKSGAFLVQKTTGDDLHMAILTEYIQQLLKDSQLLEFFIEGTRSRSGKCLNPKFGLLSICTDTYFSGQVPDVHFLPVTINYERVLEGETFPLELVGENKVTESLTHMISYFKILRQNLGKIYIVLSEPISLKQFNTKYQGNPKDITEMLGYEIVYKLQENIVVMATSIVSAILLMHRRVIPEDEIIKKVQWIRDEIEARKVKVGGIDSGASQITVRNALSHLSHVIIHRKDLFQPSVCINADYKSILLLSYYRNSLVHVFAAEAIVVCTLYSFGEIIAWGEGILLDRLIEESNFLGSILESEFINRHLIYEKAYIEKTIDFLIKRGILEKQNGKIRINKSAEMAITFLCSLIWSIIDAYWGTLTFCSAFRRKQAIQLKKLEQSIQWFMENMYEERTISYYESCSHENISNAILSFEKKGILKREAGESMMISLSENYTEKGMLEELLDHVDKFRKISLVKKVAAHHELRRALLSEFPELPKL